jgi:2-oxoglutarate dehydrogenase E2 component (dihydrolipoamide succinyltransferase)
VTDIRVPKLNNNDARHTLVEWLVDEGAAVTEGDPLLVLETSKATHDVCAPTQGLLLPQARAGEEYEVGAVLGRLCADDAELVAARSTVDELAAGKPVTGMVVTAPAAALVERLGISADRLAATGLRVIRREDVERLAESGPRRQQLPRPQQAVAEVVTRSHTTIPAGFAAVVVDVGTAVEFARAATKQQRVLVGLPELVVAALAALFPRFTEMFASPHDDHTFAQPDAPHIALTVDTGTGLYLPVIRDAHERSLREISAATMDMRLSAMRNGFTAGELSGANIVVSLNNEPDVLLAQPFVFPGHTCAVSLGGVREVLKLVSGEVRSRPEVTLGLAYDHRFVNGRAAVAFLREIKSVLEATQAPVQAESAGDGVR